MTAPVSLAPTVRFLKSYREQQHLSVTKVVRALTIIGLVAVILGGLCDCPTIAYAGAAVSIAGLITTAIYYCKKSQLLRARGPQMMRLVEAMHALYSSPPNSNLEASIKKILERLTPRERKELWHCIALRYETLEQIPPLMRFELDQTVRPHYLEPSTPMPFYTKMSVYIFMLITSALILFHIAPDSVIDSFHGNLYVDLAAAVVGVRTALYFIVNRERNKIATQHLSPDVLYDKIVARKLKIPAPQHLLSEQDCERFVERVKEDPQNFLLVRMALEDPEEYQMLST